MKDYFSDDFKDLLEGMLDKDPLSRLNMEGVKSHPFFKKISFDDLLDKKMKPPCKPTVKSE